MLWGLPQDLFGVCLRLVAVLLAWAGLRAWRRRAAEQVRGERRGRAAPAQASSGERPRRAARDAERRGMRRALLVRGERRGMLLVAARGCC